ncbi:unnamed protein product [Chironomus riparius]|uniref:Uncharacterized protein n=1 Tax=Chironomus riparius TaxID=315576 RepID=A0A9N9RUJ4_9DIPT|nr:unnamed protein product [Chironomus riparius]
MTCKMEEACINLKGSEIRGQFSSRNISMIREISDVSNLKQLRQ